MAVTRPIASQAGESEDRLDAGKPEGGDRLSRLLTEAGMIPVPFPLLRLTGPADPDGFAREIAGFLGAAAHGPSRPHLRRWVVFTSRNALPPFLAALEAGGRAPEDLAPTGPAPVRVAAVGVSTARALTEAGLPVDLVPDRFAAEDLLEALLRADEAVIGPLDRPPDLDGAAFLFPRGERARDVIPRGLEERGARVHAPVAYRTVADEASGKRLVEAVFAGELDVVTLTSSSAADVLASALGSLRAARGGEPAEWPSTVRIAVIGPVTARTAWARGLRVDVEPTEATLPGLARAIARGAT